MVEETKRQLEQTIRRDYRHVAGIVLQVNGQTHYEQSFHVDTATHPVHVFSVTKSIVSLLIGVAIDKGYIRSVHQKVLEFFPDYTVKRGEKTVQTITIEHLLTMTAPFKFRSPPYTRFFSSDDWVKASLDLLGGRRPAGTFRYMEMIGPDILSGILVRATGRSVLDFARETVFSPLGIAVPSPILLPTAEDHVAFIKTNAASGWVADDQGTNTAGWGLTLTARDMANIGQLYLQGGLWEGKRIVSGEWIRTSTSEHSRWTAENLPYGYLWWTGIGDAYAAIGQSGNIIYVNPVKQMVLAITALFQPTAPDILELIERDIEPIVETPV